MDWIVIHTEKKLEQQALEQLLPDAELEGKCFMGKSEILSSYVLILIQVGLSEFLEAELCSDFLSKCRYQSF